jgi:hypothetical protein
MDCLDILGNLLISLIASLNTDQQKEEISKLLKDKISSVVIQDSDASDFIIELWVYLYYWAWVIVVENDWLRTCE